MPGGQTDNGHRCLNRYSVSLSNIRRSTEGDMRDLRDTYQNQLVPMVVEQTMRGERAYDIYSLL